MSEYEYLNLRLAQARITELMEAKQRSRMPRQSRRRKAVTDRLHRFADRLDN
jgi:hypothetical protein